MLHYKLQAGCLIIILYIAFVYWWNKRKGKEKYKWKIFDTMLVIGILYMILDILTVYMVNHLETVNDMVNRILHLGFLASMDIMIFVIFLYMLQITECISEEKKYLWYILWIPLILNMVVLVANIGSLEFRKGNVSNYSMGVSVYTCFTMVAVYEFLSVFIFLRRWSYIDKYKRTAIGTVLLIMVVVAGYQMMVPDSLVTSMVIVMFILGIYINMETPSQLELERYRGELVYSFSNVIESRDGSTGGHVKRTSKYVELIIQELKRNGHYTNILTKDYIENLVKAAPMHDIGKIATPDNILQKPGRLTQEELEIMKQHTVNGAKLVRKSLARLGDEQYIDIVHDVVLYHHEKWNGKGYPEGRKGEEIPLCARVMAVADVFDAVVEKRCYREAMTLEQGFAIIEEGAGSDFEPLIAEAFLNHKEKVIEIHNSFLPSCTHEEV